MGLRRAAAAVVLLGLAAGGLRADPGWTVKNPAIARKSTGRAAAGLCVLVLGGTFLLRRRR